MISRREANLDRNVLRTLVDPEYIMQRRQAWQRCVELDAEAAIQAAQRAQEEHGWWTGERERQLVAEAEAERDRRRAVRYEEQLAGLRKPVQSEAAASNDTGIRRVK
jgi:hypothetical protein